MIQLKDLKIVDVQFVLKSILILLFTQYFSLIMMYFFDISFSLNTIISTSLVFILFIYLNRKSKLKHYFLWIIVFSILYSIYRYNMQFFESSVDGNMYHGDAMIQIINGWNPVLGTNIYRVNVGSDWAALYPKFTWVVGATWIKLFGTLNAGLYINQIIAILTSIKTCLFTYKKSHNIFISAMTSLLVFVNPIFLEQMHTYYVDALLGNLTIFLLISNLEYLDDGNIDQLIEIFILSVLLVNVKFTGFVFAAIIGLSVFLYLLVSRSKTVWNYFSIGIAIFIFGVIILGYNPYIINVLKGRHIFYPLMGKEAWDIISGVIPVEIVNYRALQKFFYSISNGLYFENLLDFIQKGYLFYDQRIGGFGIHFFKFFVGFSLLVPIYILKSFKNINVSLIAVFIAWILSIVANYSTAWWARYVPQLWLIVPIIFLLSQYAIKNKIIKISLGILIIFLSIQQSLDIYVNTYQRDREITLKIQDVYSKLGNDPIDISICCWNYVNFSVIEEYRLKEVGIRIDQMYFEPIERSKRCYRLDFYELCVYQ